MIDVTFYFKPHWKQENVAGINILNFIKLND